MLRHCRIAAALTITIVSASSPTVASERLAYTFTPAPDEGIIRVELRWQTGDREQSTLAIQPHWASVPDIPMLLKQVSVTAGKFRREENRWIIDHQPSAEIRCEYEIRGESQPDWDGSYYPIVTNDHFHGIGETFLITPNDDDASSNEYDISIDWKLPGAWPRAASSIGVGKHVSATLTLRDLRNAIYLAGHIQTRTQIVLDQPVTVAVAGEFEFSADELLSLCARIIGAERNFLPEAPLPAYLITAVTIGRPLPKGSTSMGGTGLHNSFALFLPPKAESNDALQHLLAHELFHHWNGRVLDREQPEELVYWFSEGLTEYYALRLLYESGIWDVNTLCTWINRHIAAYHRNPAKNATNEEILQEFWTKRKTVGQAPYQRGVLLAIRWHALAQQHDRGVRASSTPGIDALFHELLRQAINDDTKITNDRIRAAGIEKLGNWFADEFDRFVIEAETIEVPPDALAPAIVGKPATIYEFALGFDRDRSIAERRIIDLVPDSPAAEAGLQENDELTSWSIGDDPDHPVRLDIRRDDKTKTIRYVPRGQEIRVLRFEPTD